MNKATEKLYDYMSTVLTKADVYASDAIAEVSGRIIMERNKRGLSQKQFAEFMGVSQGMISKWESGEYNFTVESIAKISEKLSCSLKLELIPENAYFENSNIDKWDINPHLNYILSEFPAA
ncbi:MAG: helix-turn-helix transcriptional regulator [Firmicutes bacterium]|nr:helix-turn-helix transcriptional regulator [Bacillota bacterium]